MHKVIKLDGDICANCASKIEDQIKKIDGVENVRVNAMTLKFTLDADDDKFDDILDESVRIFGKIEPSCEVLV